MYIELKGIFRIGYFRIGRKVIKVIRIIITYIIKIIRKIRLLITRIILSLNIILYKYISK